MILDKHFFFQLQMARGHQKELARQRNEKNAAAGKPTTQKGTAGKMIVIQDFLIRSILISFSCWFDLSMSSLQSTKTVDLFFSIICLF